MFYYFYLYPQTEMAFLELIKKQAVNMNKSIGELAVDVPYKMRSIDEVVTKFGPAIAYRMDDTATGGTTHIRHGYTTLSHQRGKSLDLGSRIHKQQNGGLL